MYPVYFLLYIYLQCSYEILIQYTEHGYYSLFYRFTQFFTFYGIAFLKKSDFNLDMGSHIAHVVHKNSTFNFGKYFLHISSVAYEFRRVFFFKIESLLDFPASKLGSFIHFIFLSFQLFPEYIQTLSTFNVQLRVFFFPSFFFFVKFFCC